MHTKRKDWRADSHYGCPVEASLDVIGGRWKGVILFYLLDGGEFKRFNELRRLLPQITARVLTQQLRELERDEVVHRKVYAEVPPRTEYSLTEFGRSLEPVLRALRAWGLEYTGKIETMKSRAAAVEQAVEQTVAEAN